MSSENREITPRLLPVEIWEVIFEYLRWESRAALLSLNLSCRYFHLMVTPIIFKTIHVQFYKRSESGVPQNYGFKKTITLPSRKMNEQEKEQLREATRKLNALFERSAFVRMFPYIRILTVSYTPSYNTDIHSEWIGNLVANLPNLRTIRWRGIPFPPCLFMNLRGRQAPPELYFEGALEEIVGNDLLIGVPFIRSLSIAYLETDFFPSHLGVNDQLGAVILSLPNLERLRLKFQGKSRKRYRLPFHLPGNSILPSLRILTISHFHIDSEQATAWAQCLRHGKLQQLTLEGSARMYKLMESLRATGCVSNLESFTIRLTGDYYDRTHVPFREFLLHFSHLRAFSAHGLPNILLEPVVRSHGQHLRQFRFRQDGFIRFENRTGKSFRDFAPEKIKELSTKLPFVERLGIELRFKNNIPYNFLDSIALFPNLRYLELNTAIYPVEDIWPKKGWIDASVAEQTFRYVDQIKTGVQLEGLDIRAEPWGHYHRCIRENEDADKQMPPFGWIFASRRDIQVADKIHVFSLPSKAHIFWNPLGDDAYEQTMYAAGLWDSKAKTIYGPPILRNKLIDVFY